MKKTIIPLFILVLLIPTACNKLTKTTKTETKKIEEKEKKHRYDISLKTYKPNDYTHTVGDSIPFYYTTNAQTKPDSIKLIVENKTIKVFKNKALYWLSSKSKTGNIRLNFMFYWGDSIQQSEMLNIKLKSDIVPEKYTYKVIKTWQHNTKAYTQGLEFDEGILYESTGQYGESMLTKIQLENETVLQSINLPSDVFGEGITILDDKVYQLTWKSSIGYVYDKNTLNKLYEFNYPTDGWGLANNGKELIMSDGTENIYFLDKEYFSEIRRIQVYDNEGLVDNINELEFIDGLVYANIYYTYEIIAFDPENGKVMKKIDLSGIVNHEKEAKKIDVLNGIAFDETKNRLIVTGKWWSKFYHIKISPIIH